MSDLPQWCRRCGAGPFHTVVAAQEHQRTQHPQVGAFARYTDEAHRDVVLAFPELGHVVVRQTYEEAEAFALLRIMQTLKAARIDRPVKMVHHPPRPDVDETGDPLEAVGSWGWKTS